MSDASTLLRDARRRASLTQAEWARRADTSQSAISAYESGRRDPSSATLVRLLAAAGFELQLSPAPAPNANLPARIAAHRAEIIAIIERFGGRTPRVFGSFARGEATESSDLDLLVDLPERTGMLTLGRIAEAIEALVGIDTDVVPAASLRANVRAQVLTEAIAL